MLEEQFNYAKKQYEKIAVDVKKSIDILSK